MNHLSNCKTSFVIQTVLKFVFWTATQGHLQDIFEHKDGIR